MHKCRGRMDALERRNDRDALPQRYI